MSHYLKPRRPRGSVCRWRVTSEVDGVQLFSAGIRVGVSEGGSSLRRGPAPGVKARTGDHFSDGSHNQQHLRAVLCNPILNSTRFRSRRVSPWPVVCVLSGVYESFSVSMDITSLERRAQTLWHQSHRGMSVSVCECVKFTVTPGNTVKILQKRAGNNWNSLNYAEITQHSS